MYSQCPPFGAAKVAPGKYIWHTPVPIQYYVADLFHCCHYRGSDGFQTTVNEAYKLVKLRSSVPEAIYETVHAPQHTLRTCTSTPQPNTVTD